MNKFKGDYEQRAYFVTKYSRVNFKELQQIIKMGLVQGNLIPAFAGAWLAVVMTNHSFLSSIPQILLMLFGSTLIMGGACALNNYYDQDIDRIMPSKQNRPTVNNRITDQNLLLLSFGMMLVGEICLFLEYTIRRTWSWGL